jgi:hypothetical protein
MPTDQRSAAFVYLHQQDMQEVAVKYVECQVRKTSDAVVYISHQLNQCDPNQQEVGCIGVPVLAQVQANDLHLIVHRRCHGTRKVPWVVAR